MKKLITIQIVIYIFLSVFTLNSIARSFLWEVDVNGEKSFILGSIHMLKKSVYPLKKELEEGFKGSEFLVVEADISTKNMGEILRITMEKAGYKDGSKLKDHLSKKTYELAKKKIAELSMSIDYFENFKPWFLAMTITSMEIMKLGFDPNIGVDKYFINKAEGKKILELEGIPFQIGIFDNFSDKENDMFLISSLQEADSLSANIESMVTAWKDGDTLSIAKMILKNKNEFPELEDIFNIIIDKRNKTMAEKIENWLKKGGKYFIIAGAAHLVGKKGIINILKERGFKLKQI